MFGEKRKRIALIERAFQASLLIALKISIRHIDVNSSNFVPDLGPGFFSFARDKL